MTDEKPLYPRVGKTGFRFSVPVQPLFASSEEAHQELLRTFFPIVREAEAAAGRRWSDRMVLKRFAELWAAWRLYAPRESARRGY